MYAKMITTKGMKKNVKQRLRIIHDNEKFAVPLSSRPE